MYLYTSLSCFRKSPACLLLRPWHSSLRFNQSSTHTLKLPHAARSRQKRRCSALFAITTPLWSQKKNPRIESYLSPFTRLSIALITPRFIQAMDRSNSCHLSSAQCYTLWSCDFFTSNVTFNLRIWPCNAALQLQMLLLQLLWAVTGSLNFRYANGGVQQNPTKKHLLQLPIWFFPHSSVSVFQLHAFVWLLRKKTSGVFVGRKFPPLWAGRKETIRICLF